VREYKMHRPKADRNRFEKKEENDGVTVPYPYLMVCFKNIYLRMLFKEAYRS
jgi:hypothetical protein